MENLELKELSKLVEQMRQKKFESSGGAARELR